MTNEGQPGHDDFARFNALSFDCYGTLIDWESGIAAELQPWAARHGVTATSDDLLEAFGAAETLVQGATPGMLYPELLAETLGHLDRRFGVTSSAAEAESFGASVGRWPAFADTAEALARLKERYRLIILSNIDRQSFAASAPKLGVELDFVLTAQDVGAYKPSPASFPALFEALKTIDVERSTLLHVAQSLYHDHVPAKAVGLPTVWIDRRHDRPGFGATPQPAVAVHPDWQFPSMAAFADAAT
jgi:2-haloacid dehalogenase